MWEIRLMWMLKYLILMPPLTVPLILSLPWEHQEVCLWWSLNMSGRVWHIYSSYLQLYNMWDGWSSYCALQISIKELPLFQRWISDHCAAVMGLFRWYLSFSFLLSAIRCLCECLSARFLRESRLIGFCWVDTLRQFMSRFIIYSIEYRCL